MRTVKWMCGVKLTTKQAVGGRPTQYAPTPLLLWGRRSASRRRADRACRVQTAT